MNIVQAYKYQIYKMIFDDLYKEVQKCNDELYCLINFINPELNDNHTLFETIVEEMEDGDTKQKLSIIIQRKQKVQEKIDELDSIFYNDDVPPLFEKLMSNKDYMSHVSNETIKKLASNKEITLEEYKDLRANSYERKLLTEKLSNEALEYSINLCMKNTIVPNHASFVPVTYEETLIHTYVPELLKRLKNARIF
jgi:hypothetical protein